MHELSNDGARAQFDKLINRVLLTVMVDCAKVGGAVGRTVGGADLNVYSNMHTHKTLPSQHWDWKNVCSCDVCPYVHMYVHMDTCTYVHTYVHMYIQCAASVLVQ